MIICRIFVSGHIICGTRVDKSLNTEPKIKTTDM